MSNPNSQSNRIAAICREFLKHNPVMSYELEIVLLRQLGENKELGVDSYYQRFTYEPTRKDVYVETRCYFSTGHSTLKIVLPVAEPTQFSNEFIEWLIAGTSPDFRAGYGSHRDVIVRSYTHSGSGRILSVVPIGTSEQHYGIYEYLKSELVHEKTRSYSVEFNGMLCDQWISGTRYRSFPRYIDISLERINEMQKIADYERKLGIR